MVETRSEENIPTTTTHMTHGRGLSGRDRDKIMIEVIHPDR